MDAQRHPGKFAACVPRRHETALSDTIHERVQGSGKLRCHAIHGAF
jgi:hypothetical protein